MPAEKMPAQSEGAPELGVIEGGKVEKREAELKTQAQEFTEQIRQKIKAGQKVKFNNTDPEFVRLKDTMLQLESSRRIEEAEYS